MADLGFWRLSGTELLEGYAKRAFSPVEVLDELLDRIDRLNPVLHAFFAINEKDARASAAAAEKRWLQPGEKPALLGLPVSIKDTFDMEGLPSTYGSLAFKDNYQPDAEMVHRLRVAGAVITGKTNTPEFALAGPVGGRLTPDPTNAWDTARTSGVSSAGAGSSVAAGLGPLALGTDSGGSVRMPAAYNGIFGLKPTYQRIPAAQTWRAGPDRSHIGPMTRTVRDSALLMQHLSGFDSMDPDSNHPDEDYMSFAAGNLRGKRIAVSQDFGYVTDMDPEVVAMFQDAIELLRYLGAEIIEDTPPVLTGADELEPGTWAFSGDHYHAAEAILPNFWEEHADELTDANRPVYEAGRRAKAWQYRRAIKRTRLFESQMHRWLSHYDLLLTPTGGPAPRLDEIQVVHGKGKLRYDFMVPFNHAHVPAATVPFSFHSCGMPMSIQLVGPHRADVAVLQASAAIEAVRPWAHNWPELAESLA